MPYLQLFALDFYPSGYFQAKVAVAKVRPIYLHLNIPKESVNISQIIRYFQKPSPLFPLRFYKKYENGFPELFFQTFGKVTYLVCIKTTHQLSQGAEGDMANILQVSHILPTYFTNLKASEITAKYEKRVKYMPILHEANVR